LDRRQDDRIMEKITNDELRNVQFASKRLLLQEDDMAGTCVVPYKMSSANPQSKRRQVVETRPCLER
jgi:hypothetical protein